MVQVAYDPRDMGDSDEERVTPKLTIMEEILLLGLKDKQVRALPSRGRTRTEEDRATSPSGTTTFPTRYEDVYCSSWRCGIE